MNQFSLCRGLLSLTLLFFFTPLTHANTTHQTMPFPKYGRWCGKAAHKINIQLKSRRRWGWNPVDRLCRDFYRCCKETTKTSGDQKGLCHCSCYRNMRRKLYRAIRRTRSRKGRRVGHRISRILKFHRCRCSDYNYCKTGRRCRVENVCRHQQRVCKKGRCRWIRRKTCSRQVQCYLLNRCVSLTRNGNGGRCDARSKVLENSDNQYKVRYLHRVMKKK